VVIDKFWSVFDGAFPNIKIITIITEEVDGHQRIIKLWEAWGMQFSNGNSMDLVSAFTHTNLRCNITLKVACSLSLSPKKAHT
jgi:hypothetical protein